jgi:hypothetical protein
MMGVVLETGIVRLLCLIELKVTVTKPMRKRGMEGIMTITTSKGKLIWYAGI